MQDFSNLVEKVENTLIPYFRKIEKRALFNQEKVLNAFHHVKASESDLQGSTGYGYDDFGRDHLEQIYAHTFKADDALVRPQIISGTHAITLALQSTLKNNDELLYITGSPYDTLLEVIGINGNGVESLKEYGVRYNEVELRDGRIDIPKVITAINDNTKVVAIQRSKGYDQRPSITINEIEQAITSIKEVYPNIIIFVDNCYGEFVEDKEPIEVGADLIAGSLIKNPGGGLAKIGGYIAGRPLYSSAASDVYKRQLFTSLLLEKINMKTSPKYNVYRTDLIQTVQFETKEQMISFCQSIQHASPINAHFSPEPSYMPGYEDDVIMAAGTFIQGSSIELSADGPIRPPYEAYVQGGLTYEHVKLAVTRAVQHMQENNLL